MKTFVIGITIVVGSIFFAMLLATIFESDMPTYQPMPHDILRFQPVCKGSDPNLVRIAQAELCRHGIDIGAIDGDCGKATALGICELLVKIQNGYKVRSIYERNPKCQSQKNRESQG